LKPLSLNRLAPNLLSAEGAAEFAYDSGIPLFPHDKLISKRAKAAWRSWRRELDDLDAPMPSQASRTGPDMRLRYDELMNQNRIDHSIRPRGRHRDSDLYVDMACERSESGNSDSSPELAVPRGISALGNSAANTPVLESVLADRHPAGGNSDSPPCSPPPPFLEVEMMDGRPVPNVPASSHCFCSHLDCKVSKRQSGVGNRGGQQGRCRDHGCQFQSLEDDVANTGRGATVGDDLDDVSDTIGVIVVDTEGNMSCAASSGGLGLKMRGRVGPAALNGVGAYLIPPDPSDPSKLGVSCVASGTGEHMTTTLASGISAERVYHCKAKHTAGVLVPCAEEDVLKQFIEKEFLRKCTLQPYDHWTIVGVEPARSQALLKFAPRIHSFFLSSTPPSPDSQISSSDLSCQTTHLSSIGAIHRCPQSSASSH
jgi:taspase (threonine aspartase 1)